jgi:hypothetical protein
MIRCPWLASPSKWRLPLTSWTSGICLWNQFWTQGPNSWDATCQVGLFAPICQIKRHGAEKGNLLQDSGHAVERGRVSTQPIFSHLWSTDMSYRFKYIRELGAGDKGMHS